MQTTKKKQIPRDHHRLWNEWTTSDPVMQMLLYIIVHLKSAGKGTMAPHFDSLSVYIAYPVIRIIQTVKQWQRLRPYLSRNSWVEGFYYVKLSMYNILSRTWQHDTRNVAMIPPGRVEKYVYVYTLDIPTLWRTAVSLLHLALVQLLLRTRAIQERTQRSAEAFFVHGCQDLNHPSSIILHLHPSKTNGRVLKSLEIHLTFRFSSAWRIHASPVTSFSCSHYDLHLSCLSCYFSRRRS